MGRRLKNEAALKYGQALRVLRQQLYRGSLVQFSEEIGLSKSYLSEIETSEVGPNSHPPSLATLEKYAAVLNISLASIMFFVEHFNEIPYTKFLDTKIYRNTTARKLFSRAVLNLLYLQCEQQEDDELPPTRIPPLIDNRPGASQPEPIPTSNTFYIPREPIVASDLRDRTSVTKRRCQHLKRTHQLYIDE